MTNFNEKDFKTKIVETLEKVPIVLDIVALYYCLKDEKTSLTIKTQIIGALLYFISPLDIIPDTIPVVGYSDDTSMIFALINTISNYITDEHYQQAKKFLKEIKGG